MQSPLTLRQRQVLDALRREAKPMTAYALLAQLRASGFSAPTQLYRALGRLTEQGLGRIDELIDDSLGEHLARLADRRKFTVKAMSIELRGHCSHCTSQLQGDASAHRGNSLLNQAKQPQAQR